MYIQNKAYNLLLRLMLIGTVSFTYTYISSNDSGSSHNIVRQEDWVAQVLQNLSEEERIAQLFMVAAYSNKPEKHCQAIEDLIRRYNIGGLIFFQGDPVSQVTLTNRYQQAAKTLLLIAMDAEWGVGMRLDSTISYPRQMTLGAIEDNQLIYNMGAEIARQLKLLGVHINFAPVVDVNTNPTNPGIGVRSFGDSKEAVASKGLAYIKGLQDQGVLAVAKHFPGKGDASKDAHYVLPIILHDTTRLDELELFPFKEAIAAGVGGIMVSHMYIPAYDTTANRASSLSEKVVTDLLKEQLGFKGLVFTDALNMKAVSKYYQPGEVDLVALKAGNDVLLFPEDVPKAIRLIKQAIDQGELDRAYVEEKVKRILQLKYKMHLHQWKPIETTHLHEQLCKLQAHLLKRQLFEQAITVIANKDELIPLKKLDKRAIASLSIIGKPATQKINDKASETTPSDSQPHKTAPSTRFAKSLQKYAPISCYTLNRESLSAQALHKLASELKKYQVVIIDIHHMRGGHASNFGLQEEELQCLKSLKKGNTKVIVVPFGSVYSLALFQDFEYVIAAYEDDPIAEQVVPQIIFGALPAKGNLPVTIPGA